MSKRRNHSPAFKAKVALGAVRGERTLAELAQQHEVHRNVINQWRARLLEDAADVFGAKPAVVEPPVDVTVLHAKIGESTHEAHVSGFAFKGGNQDHCWCRIFSLRVASDVNDRTPAGLRRRNIWQASRTALW